MNYSKEEVEVINIAWYLLEKICDTNWSAECTLHNALKTEKKNREDVNAKVLIIGAIYSKNKIKKHEIFHFSNGIMQCIIMANSIFYRQPVAFNNFKKIAKPAIKAHDDYMGRLCASMR